jgi:hypothetical protein
MGANKTVGAKLVTTILGHLAKHWRLCRDAPDAVHLLLNFLATLGKANCRTARRGILGLCHDVLL